MRLIFKHQHEGVWFSHNGHKAYLRGEKPLSMWPKGADVEPTVEHHIARYVGSGSYSRNLVMFYKLRVVLPAANPLKPPPGGWPPPEMPTDSIDPADWWKEA